MTITFGRPVAICAILFHFMIAAAQQPENAGPAEAATFEQDLDKATNLFNEELESAIEQVASAIDSRLEAAMKAGNLEEAVSLRKTKQELQASGDPPRNPLVASAVERARREISRASSKLTSTYARIAKELVKTGDVDSAQRILDEKAEVLAGMSQWLDRGSRPTRRAPPFPKLPAAQAPQQQGLQESLAGSVWIHHYLGGNFEFGFGRDGTIQLHKNWAGTRWSVTGPREVTFVGTTGATMKFNFNDAITSFTNVDWDGKTPTSGTRTDRKVP
jgi:hypothetical protein